MKDKERLQEIYKRLRETYQIHKFRKCTPFESLILTILSQNTNDKNRDRGYDRLVQAVEKITPEVLSSCDLEVIREAISVAGLHNQKSSRIQGVSKTILDQFGGSVEAILQKPLEEARKLLIELKGVGYKTADILLLFYANYLTLPVDTHITRVSKRLGFAPVKGKYEDIRKGLQEHLEPSLPAYKEFHLLLIEHGRHMCKALKPSCSTCVIEDHCPKIIIKKAKKAKKRTRS